MSAQDIAIVEAREQAKFKKSSRIIREDSAHRAEVKAAFMEEFQKMPLTDQRYFVDWCIGFMEANQ